MCGIAGLLETGARNGSEALSSVATRMADRLFHRGPDAGGVWADDEAGVGLGHRRLSILDLSPAGAQPMHSESGRFVTVFNGEIYNFARLRDELAGLGHQFRGHSDTEVMLAAFEQWGVPASVPKLDGMFAIAVWDRLERVLWLARDRMGEKPLYYGWSGERFFFGSELKAFHGAGKFNAALDHDAIAEYLRYRYVPAPRSIYKNISKLTPGTYVRVTSDPSADLNPVPYWSVRDVADAGQRNPTAMSYAEAMNELDSVLKQVVLDQMVSDVPLGTFLSGGVDSSLITAMMQSQSSRPVRSFTIGFHEAQFNEAELAASVAKHLGTDHTEMYVTADDALALIPGLAQTFDEPFADSSQIPTMLLAKLTRQHVTVSLSGDGGDEMFGGYSRYRRISQRWDRVARLGMAGRQVVSSVFGVAAPVLDSPAGKLLPSRLGKAHNRASSLRDYSWLLQGEGSDEFYVRAIQAWREPPLRQSGSAQLLREMSQRIRPAQLPDFVSRQMLLDTLVYLPDDIMVKVDRSAMAASLESRAPLLDRRVAEFAWKLPLRMKYRDGAGKVILRELLYKYVPRELVDRPKVGFGVPLAAWLRGPLRDWAEDLLSLERLKDDGIFDMEMIRKTWKDHLDGKFEHPARLWIVLMFQEWKRTWAN